MDAGIVSSEIEPRRLHSESAASDMRLRWWGMRRKRDSNPRYGSPYSGFQDRRFQPLTHSSGI